jgi:hypothetical protein
MGNIAVLYKSVFNEMDDFQMQLLLLIAETLVWKSEQDMQTASKVKNAC